MTTTATAQFFDELALQPHQVLLERADGVLQFELSHGKSVDSWTVTVAHGAVGVEHGRAHDRATCVVGASRDLFDNIVAGRANATAALLRGEMRAEGDLRLLLLFSRVVSGSLTRA